MRTFIRCVGLCTPGVSTNTTWPVVVVLHADDPRARRLRLVGHDRELLADDAIEEGGLAGVGTTEEGDEAGLHCSAAQRLGVLCVAAAHATLVMRRRSTSRTSNDSSSMSNDSPTYGMRPR